MKKITRILLTTLLCLALLSLTGCGGNQKDTRQGITWQEQEVTITWEVNATTGYAWTCENPAEDVLTLTNDKYIAPGEDEAAKTVGAGGFQQFTFEGKKAGSVDLVFTYSRPFEDEPADENVVIKTIYVTVGDDGVIKDAKEVIRGDEAANN